MFFCISKPINLSAIRIEKRSRKVKTSFPAYRTDFPVRTRATPRAGADSNRLRPKYPVRPNVLRIPPLLILRSLKINKPPTLRRFA